MMALHMLEVVKYKSRLLSFFASQYKRVFYKAIISIRDDWSFLTSISELPNNKKETSFGFSRIVR